MFESTDKPSVDERYAGAVSTSDLTTPDEWRPTDAYVLVASGLGRKGLGGALMRLRSEWSRTAKPTAGRALTVAQYAAKIPMIVTKVEAGRSVRAPDFKKAAAMAAEAQKAIPSWYDAEIRMVKHKLVGMPQVRDHLCIWAYEKQPENAEDVVAEVLLYWLDDSCGTCRGLRWQVVPNTSRLSNRKCPCCNGTGIKEEPTGLGQRMLDYMNQCIYDWRQSTSGQLRNMSGRGKAK